MSARCVQQRQDRASASLAGLGVAPADVLSLYRRVLPPEFFPQLRKSEGLGRQNNRVYTDAVVIWLMIVQRLMAAGTMEKAVLELLRGLPEDFWPRPCERLRKVKNGEAELSGNTGSFNGAREGLPGSIVEHGTDRAFWQMLEEVGPPATTARRQVFFVDGSSMRTPHRKELAAQYPPGSNQHGKSHWPLLRIVVAHDLYSGLAMRPEWGALNGAAAVSEQALLEKLMQRLPSGCALLGDANFGVFSVAYAAQQRSHAVVLRLTMVRAKALARQNQAELQDGMDLRLQWRPTKEERKKHPETPVDACVEGRLVVREVRPEGKKPLLLALFTTLEEPAETIIELYGDRWNIETDLRHLKDTLRLGQLTSTTPAMVAKEIDVAMMAYNLVRAVICAAAQKAGLQPRQFSFTRVNHVINAFAPLIAAAQDPAEKQRLREKMMYYVAQAKHPRRNRKRPSYPRAVWPKPEKYAKRRE